MMRRLLNILIRLLAVIFALPGALALGFLVAVVLAGGGRATAPFGQVWFQNDPFQPFLHTASLPLFGAIIERRVSPFLWDPILTTILNWPSWVGLSVLAVIFLLIASLFWALSRRVDPTGTRSQFG